MILPPFGRVRDLSDDELAAFVLGPCPGDKHGAHLHGLARGEYTERRITALASKLAGVRSAKRASEDQDRKIATDVVVVLCEQRVVRLQVKSRERKKTDRSVRRARRFGARIVRAAPETPDHLVRYRIEVALGLALVPCEGDGACCETSRDRKKRERREMRREHEQQAEA